MAFTRPHRTHPLPPWHGARPPGVPAQASGEAPFGAVPAGTMAALFGVFATGLFLNGDRPTELARFGAWGVGISIAAALLIDLKRGIHNLARTDVLAIVGLYFLTLFEFIFTQAEFDTLTDAPSARAAILVCLWGFAGLLLGRHIRVGGHRSLATLLARPAPSHWLIWVFLACLFLGHLQMLVAVNFNALEMIDAFMGPRFSQPWGRGRLGDWKALLYELSMLLYLVPPVAGIVIARRHAFSSAQIALVTAGLLFELFYGFTSGTRNLFISFLLTFIIGYAFSMPRTRRKELMVILATATVVALISTKLMLDMRSIGFKAWMGGLRESGEIHEKLMHVDMNLYVISQLVDTFPKRQPYLGLEVPWLALVRPIPRALWPGKPEGLSVNMESVSGTDEHESWTVAASFVGEAYIAAGVPGVLFAGIFFGAFATWWSRLASRRNSELGILIYAAGFFAIAISMRSLFVFTTALLPTIAAIIGTRALVRSLASKLPRRGHL